ncbi:hypothetical protein EDEG_01349 [Edhazardia aedis USNM 41457]|uniref:Uncharacterized protein n=1 Tax=Edhazardia aedis (strain USNM 41457) TaxID=1003232 RepID=J9D9H1_EDHAE|nr:hypothetical protein EDEG_01349 [Edhazardia aedis USNM 41457]|eukprot:EJW04421.1 hypothetical protein EDEG_01349 [Edhazardia aedis USNM 41457]
MFNRMFNINISSIYPNLTFLKKLKIEYRNIDIFAIFLCLYNQFSVFLVFSAFFRRYISRVIYNAMLIQLSFKQYWNMYRVFELIKDIIFVLNFCFLAKYL